MKTFENIVCLYNVEFPFCSVVFIHLRWRLILILASCTCMTCANCFSVAAQDCLQLANNLWNEEREQRKAFLDLSIVLRVHDFVSCETAQRQKLWVVCVCVFVCVCVVWWCQWCTFTIQDTYPIVNPVPSLSSLPLISLFFFASCASFPFLYLSFPSLPLFHLFHTARMCGRALSGRVSAEPGCQMQLGEFLA